MKIRNLLVAVSLAGIASAAAAAMDVISAKDQKVANKSVIAASVSASKAGYLVVHKADATGTKPGKIIGNVAVQAGENKDVTVPLTSDVKAGSKLILMLHEESNGDAKFDEKDKPVMVDGKMVMQPITVQ
jgi:uncharacterized protein YdbL (DUF1318 family)